MSPDVRLKVLGLAMGRLGGAEAVNEAIGQAERILECRVALDRRREAALESYKAEAREVDALLERLQRDCQHPATTYHMGGLPGDSFSTCDLCLAVV